MRRTLPLAGAILLAGIPAAGAAPASEAARYAALARRIDTATRALMGDPARALQLADRVLASAKALPRSRRAELAIATGRWLDAEAHLGLNDVKRAGPLADAALATVEALAPGTKLHGDLLRTKGAIAATEGRSPQALAYFQRAYRVFVAARVERSQAIALQDIGQVFDSAGDPTRALGYYAQAIEAYDKDPALLLANFNNRAEGLRKLRRAAAAEAEYKRALAQARRLGSDVLELRVLCNLADVQGERGAFAAAQASVARAERLARGGEAAGWRPFVLGTAAKIAVAARDYPRAGVLFDRMFAGIDLATTDTGFTEFHQAASLAFEKLGRPALALAHLRAYQRLDDGGRELAASAGAQLAAARFDFATQTLRISDLKAKQLRQQVQLERRDSRIRTLTTTGLLAIAAIVVAFLSFALVTGRRARDRLRLVNVDLARALKAKTEFLAMTSHEIRTPLNGILGMTQVILTERALRPDLRERIRLVQGAGETMRALVDDILDVAKMERGAIALAEEDVDVGAMLGEIAGLWRDQASARGVAVVEEVDALPPLVRTDPARLRQLVFNLLSNAVKFTAHGEVTLRVHADAAAGRLVIAVADTGIGIDPSQLETIFEPFHQADAATTRQFGGTGLGLAICRKVAEALGGEIGVASAPGAGATFTVTLPLVIAHAAPFADASPRPPARELGGARVMLVEPNLLAQALLNAVLAKATQAVEAQADPADAVAALARGGFDHVLIDAGCLPGDPAAELSRVIAAARDAGVRSTVLVPPAGPIAVETAAATGADQVIAKPVSGAALLARMRELYDPDAQNPADAKRLASA